MNKEKLLQIKKFDSKGYKNIPMDNLILYAVWKVQELELEKNFYNICVAAFKLFPNKFSLLGYSQYPDSKRIHDCLWHCFYKTKGWLIGKTKHGFDFSPIGLKILEKTTSRLKDPKCWDSGKSTKKNKIRDGRREALIISELQNSRAFQKYQDGNIDNIEKVDICFALHGTLDTPKDIIEKNMRMIKNLIVQYGSKELLDFISIIEKKYKGLFKEG